MKKFEAYWNRYVQKALNHRLFNIWIPFEMVYEEATVSVGIGRLMVGLSKVDRHVWGVMTSHLPFTPSL